MDKALDGILRRAARLMLDFEDPQVYAKGAHADFVTEADVAVQSFLMEELSRIWPEGCFFAEEKEGKLALGEFIRVEKPIYSGTNMPF